MLLAILALAPFLNRMVHANEFGDKLDRLVEKFEERKGKLDEQMLRRFDQVIVAASRSADSSELKLNLAKAKVTFELTSQFPDDGSCIELQLEYLKELSNAYSPIQRAFATEIDSYSRRNELARLQQILGIRSAMERRLLKIEPLSEQTKFRGTKTNQTGRSVPWHLVVDSVSSTGAFEATIDDNKGVRGNWRFKAIGKREGFQVSFTMSKCLRGHFTAVQASGYLLGNTLVVEIRERDKKRKPYSAVAIMNRF
jgi:hypothetical protein|tara:strand:+ start:1763 stop:2524 length:762 start_codon:yes stop_codon:yes gene_type:complete